MGTIPVVPVFPAGLAAASAVLNELGTAITWCMSGMPLCQLQQLTAQSVPNSANTAVTWDTMIVNRDGMWATGANTRATAQTPGVYLAAASIVYAGTSTSGARSCYFRVTTGSNNPAGSGVQAYFGNATINNQSGSASTGVTSKSLTPYLYDGDYVEVIAFQNSGGALSTQPLAASEGPSYFTISLVSG
jgi:hypothetical protein